MNQRDALDTALQEVCHHGERQTLSLRLEAFDLTNYPNFRQPSSLALFDSTGARSEAREGLQKPAHRRGRSS